MTSRLERPNGLLGMAAQVSKLDRAPTERPAIARWSGISATALIVVLMAGSGVIYVLGPSKVIEVFHHLGYPEYFRKLLGLSKILGSLAIVGGNRFPRLREWAYAGFTFDLLAGALSHAFTAEAGAVLPPLITLGILALSYFLWHRPRLESVAEAGSGALLKLAK